jgi:cyclopentanol dehydrogenase
MGRVSGKVALVTGAAMGMGKAHAELLAKEGAKVILTDTNAREGENVAKGIVKKNGRADFYRHDVANEADWRRVVEQVVAKDGKIDVLINNAGIFVMKLLEDTTTEDWDKIFDVNVRGIFFGTKAVLPAMKKAGGGSIINISSIYGLVGAPMAAAYEASKGAVRLFTKACAADLAAYNIRVNSIHPGVIDTPMTKDLLADPATKTAILGTTILKRPAAPQEVSSAVLFLASDESSFVDGAELVVDGGYTAL